MKRILYIAAMASLLMTSCQKTDVLNVVEDTIDFSTEVGKLTKAATDYTAAKYEKLVDQGFRVWAFADFTLGNDTDGTIYRGINGLWVRYEDGWGIDATQKYFWPQTGNFLQFYALSYKHEDGWTVPLDSKTHLLPAVTEANGEVPAKATEVTGLALPVYTVCAEANDDIMVADHVRQDKSVTKTVKPFFRHTMTKVEFKFKKGGEESDTDAEEASVIILKGISTDPLVYKGSLDVTYSDSDANPAVPFKFKWTPETSKMAFYGLPSDVLTIVKKGGAIVDVVDEVPSTVGEIGAVCVVNGENTRTIYSCAKAEGAQEATWALVETHTYDASEKVWKSDKDTDQSEETKSAYETFVGKVLTVQMETFVTWYMIPQGIDLVETDGQVTAGRVKIDYVADGVHIEQFFGLKGTHVTTWEEELCVKYNVTIAPHKIQFSPTVGEWDPYDSDDKTDGYQDVEMVN